MAINLIKHREDLLKAWKDVLDDKTDTDWALFGYEGQTNDLKLVSKGDGGLEELNDDLNSGKIMYAFVKINDPKTSLPKCILINWQGEGANTVRKGICANHLRDIEKLFTGANLTINARNDEEVEPQLIIDKVAKAGSAYSFKAPRGDTSGPTAPIGTNYKRVNPIKEINATERDQFWLKEEEEEKRRVEQDRVRREKDRLKLEEEVKKREASEAQKRDEVTKKRDSGIDMLKQAERQASVEQDLDQSTGAESVETVNHSDMIREERNRETQNLIAQRTIDARSIFEQNTSAGQIKRTPEKPVRNSILRAQQAQVQQQITPKVKTPEPIEIEEEIIEEPCEAHEEQIGPVAAAVRDDQSDDESDQFATIKRSPKDLDKKNSVTSPTTEQETIKNDINKQETAYNKITDNRPLTEQQVIDEVIYGDFIDTGIRARALYDYQAADETEITFDPGDVITHIELVDEGWWQGMGPDGSYGLFPANYVELC